MKFQKAKLTITEYDKKNLSIPYKKLKILKESSIQVSSFSISKNIAFSILTKENSFMNRSWEIFSNYITIQNKLKFNEENLYLTSHFLRRYRDFSKTSKLGEFAQGLTYHFISEHLGYPIVHDFWDFLNLYNPGNVSAPDFVGSKIENSDSIILVESKASSDPAKIKSVFKEGQAQTKSGKKLVSNSYHINSTYTANVEFHDIDENIPIKINFIDPPGKQKQIYPNGPNFDILQKHYSYWFFIIGRFDLVNLIREGNIKEVKNRGYEEEKSFLFSPPFEYLLPLFYEVDNFFYKSNYLNIKSIEIDKSILNLLSERQSSSTNDLYFKNEITEYSESFSDGVKVNFYEKGDSV
ncbi:hypothetical protein [Leptospira bouyouniensis]|uniref:Uncharacterized protein n=1 Tax=Leptospira bouyouniensis TaxID=2484911 RepID=A0ABY2L9U4_9LEPT|nr:hypothetical protein [Leptospira bouyouniensis]TGK54260.1 hypothetical protein EHQ10_00400 [Leptospira bouyouniensis]